MSLDFFAVERKLLQLTPTFPICVTSVRTGIVTLASAIEMLAFREESTRLFSPLLSQCSLLRIGFFQDIEGKTKISFPISFFYKMPLHSRALYLTGLPIKLTRECNYKIK